MSDRVLVLQLTNFRATNAWRWVLQDSGGAFIADHQVELDPRMPQFQSLFDLPGYLHHFAAPDRREEDERRLLGDAGRWIGINVLGPVAQKIAERAPVVVRVLLPSTAEAVLSMPLEIAHAFDEPLHLQGVSLVFEITGEEPNVHRSLEIGDRLRLLALFSLPPASSPLNLRKERQLLRRLVRELRGASGKDVELRILQYGTSRKSLQDALRRGGGWDIVHFSGHGEPGTLLLEHPDGSPDPISATDIVKLIRTSGRLKLVTISACLSAAPMIEQTLLWLGVKLNENAGSASDARKEAAAESSSPRGVDGLPAPMSVARTIVKELGCAVFAMRYAVEDEFSAVLTGALYTRLFYDEQSLAEAVPSALSALALERPDLTTQALSMAAPALFGRVASQLRLVPPTPLSLRPDPPRLAYFPDEPPHFIGRVLAMTAASASLASEGRHSGVLFYGMAGAGKTSCALELAYHHEATGRFRAFVWYSAPSEGDDITLSLQQFSVALETQLGAVIPDFTMTHLIDGVEALRAGMPRVTEMLERTAVLVVIDNIETLLTPEGAWRDARWEIVVAALCKPGGLSRVILTSRVRPSDIDISVAPIAVNALPLGEAVLLVREMQNLGRLLRGDMAGVSKERGRALVRDALRVVQGHPKLIALADALAADPRQLEAQIARSTALQDDGNLDAFFESGESHTEPESFLAALRDWTNGVADTLELGQRTFFHFLCLLQEQDRESWIIEDTWSPFWRLIEHAGPAPSASALYPALVAVGLVDHDPSPADQEFAVAIHPGVVEAGSERAGPKLRTAVDVVLASFWASGMQKGVATFGQSPGAGALILRAGSSAFPYLGRLGAWSYAGAMIDQMLPLDHSPAALGALLPLARKIAAECADTENALVTQALLGRVLHRARHFPEAEQLMRKIFDQTISEGNVQDAKVILLELINVLRSTGRSEEALGYYGQMKDLTKATRAGPWTQLADEISRLQLLMQLRRHHEILDRIDSLLGEMERLPDPPGEDDSGVAPWNVREVVLEIAHTAAKRVDQRERALEFNDLILNSMRGRGATSLEMARTRMNGYESLMRLGRIDEARSLLIECRTIAESEQHYELLGMVFSALAGLQQSLGNASAASAFEKTAIRFEYLNENVSGVRISHARLGVFLQLVGEMRAAAAHLFAAAMLSFAIGEDSTTAVENLATQLAYGREDEGAEPQSYGELCSIVEAVEGVRFDATVRRLLPDDVSRNQQFREIAAKAKIREEMQRQEGADRREEPTE
jgi:tetratricopeptide (TPR) repeat protein